VRKLSELRGDEWIERSSPRVFALSRGTNAARLEADLSDAGAFVFSHVALCLRPPYFLLYVLHTPRGEGAPGRYQSPSISDAELSAFLHSFSSFLGSDGRFDIWVHSPVEKATVVWDRHDRLFAYGPIERYASALRDLGYQTGAVDPLGEHMHHYRQEFDEDAAGVLNFFDWSYSPLKREDEQRPV